MLFFIEVTTIEAFNVVVIVKNFNLISYFNLIIKYYKASYFKIDFNWYQNFNWARDFIMVAGVS